MDPNANVEEQLRIASRVLRGYEVGDAPRHEDVARLAELVQALDGWICDRGFLPARWDVRREEQS